MSYPPILFKCLLLLSLARGSVTSTAATTTAAETEQKKVRTKLMKFLMKRPTLQTVKEKGYIRGDFRRGNVELCCHLQALADLNRREKSVIVPPKHWALMLCLYQHLNTSCFEFSYPLFSSVHFCLELISSAWTAKWQNKHNEILRKCVIAMLSSN